MNPLDSTMVRQASESFGNLTNELIGAGLIAVAITAVVIGGIIGTVIGWKMAWGAIKKAHKYTK